MKDAGDKLISQWIKDANSNGLDGDKLVSTAHKINFKSMKTNPFNESQIRPNDKFGRFLLYLSTLLSILEAVF